MGMDGVEIVMMVEESFDIAIENSEAEKLLTPRDIIEHVMGKVGRADRAQCLTQRAFHRLRASLMKNAGLKRDQISPDAFTDNLFPVAQREALLRKMLDDLGIKSMPQMVRPRWLLRVLWVASITTGVVAWVWASQVAGSANLFVALLTASSVNTGAAAAMLCGWLAASLTRGMKRDFKPAQADIGGLSRWIVAHATEALGAPPGQWSREQVAERVREICIDALDCEKAYHESADFVKELGLS